MNQDSDTSRALEKGAGKTLQPPKAGLCDWTFVEESA